MTIKSMNLAWIVVNDIKKAIHYYTNTLGLKLDSFEENFGWAELSCGQGGFRLGIAQKSDHEVIQPGENAVLTMSVDNIEKTIAELSKKGARIKGDILEIPGHVKLQTMVDNDGNHFQLVETIQ